MKARVAPLQVERKVESCSALELEQLRVPLAHDGDNSLGWSRPFDHCRDAATQLVVLLGPDTEDRTDPEDFLPFLREVDLVPLGSCNSSGLEAPVQIRAFDAPRLV
jgi:hypothetical protein